jgi:hypothetical protein
MGRCSDRDLCRKTAQVVASSLQHFLGSGSDYLEHVFRLSRLIAMYFGEFSEAMESAFAGLAAIMLSPLSATEHVERKAQAAQLLTSKFPGRISTALTLFRSGYAKMLGEANEWLSWIILVGDYNDLVEWAGVRGERWHLHSEQPIIERIETMNNETMSAAQRDLALLVAPREKIHRGLSAELLSKIVSEDSTALHHNLTASGSALPEATPPTTDAKQESIGKSTAALPSSPNIEWPEWYERNSDQIKVNDAKKLLEYFGFAFTRQGHDSERLTQILTEEAEMLTKRQVRTSGKGPGRRIDREDLERVIVAKDAANKAIRHEKKS